MLSVVIPTYNRNNDLAACLASIRENSREANEIIVLSPSDDVELKEICDANRARLINDGSRVYGRRTKSLWEVINLGIDEATSDSVVWLNDDCVVLPEWDRIIERYLTNDVGLVVLRTKGINNSPEFRTIEADFGVPCANYAVLRKSIGVRFDTGYNWFYGDADISLEILHSSDFRVVATEEGLVVHVHRQDENRIRNESSPKARADEARFVEKWRFFCIDRGRVVKMGNIRIIIKKSRRCLGLMKQMVIRAFRNRRDQLSNMRQQDYRRTSK